MDYVKWQSLFILLLWCINLLARIFIPNDAAYLKMCAADSVTLLSIIALNVVWSRKK